MDLANSGLAFLAGLLSILSPCVLPLVPIVLGAAASEHRAGPFVLALGVATSFVAIGLFVATIGFSIGLDGDVFRKVAAVAAIAVGLVLAIPALQVRLAAAGGPISDWANRRLMRTSTSGLAAQFGVGTLLGTVWSPCVGPTLGAASVLAAQGSSLTSVAIIMAVFGIGAALPLVGLGLVSRRVMMAWRDRLISGGKGAKIALGVLLVGLGVSVVGGYDKQLEAHLVALSPEWLTALTTRF